MFEFSLSHKFSDDENSWTGACAGWNPSCSALILKLFRWERFDFCTHSPWRAAMRTSKKKNKQTKCKRNQANKQTKTLQNKTKTKQNKTKKQKKTTTQQIEVVIGDIYEHFQECTEIATLAQVTTLPSPDIWPSHTRWKLDKSVKVRGTT